MPEFEYLCNISLERLLENNLCQITWISQVAVLKDRLNKFTKEAAEIEIHLTKTKETISAADSLVIGLEGEYERWNSEVSLKIIVYILQKLHS